VKDETGTSSGTATLDVGVVADETGLDALADEWRALGARACNGSVFLSWEWHRTWWDVFGGSGARLHVVTVRERGALIGLLPLYRHGAGPTATLRLSGSGEASADEVVTEYGDVLASAAHAVRVGDAVIGHLATFDGWRRVVLPCLLDDALIVAACRRRTGLARLECSAGVRYRIRLDDGEAGYLERVGASRARRIARARRALERDGGLRVEPTVDAADLAVAFADLATLNDERQRALGRRGVFLAERFRRFHDVLGARLYSRDALDVVRFRLGSRLLAALYCLDDASGRHYYQSGFVGEGANRYLTLTIAHLAEMRRARDAGHRWYDLMRGHPPCYKDAFGCETTPMLDLALYRTPPEREIALRWRGLRRAVRRGLTRLRS